MPDNFRANTWFVTGATGLVGSTVVNELRENDLFVIALVRQTSPPSMLEYLESLDVKLVYGDILEPETFKQYLATCDVVVHCAAAVQEMDHSLNWLLNLEGTRNVCSAMVEMGLQRLVHISTAGVYGKAYKVPVSEEAKPQPYGPYLKSKFAAEQAIQDEFPILEATIIRPPFIYGDVERDRHVYPTLIDSLPSRFLPKVWRYNPALGFVHAEDIARMVFQVGTMAESPSIIYNIQSFDIGLNELFEMVNHARMRRSKLIPIPYSILYLGALIGDLWMKLKGKSFGIRQRLSVAKNNWTFSIKRARSELDYHPIHRDNYELERLLTEYYQMHFGDPTSINMRDMMNDDDQ